MLTSNASPKRLENLNKLIEDNRRNVDADIDVIYKLCEEVIGPADCSPKLHSLHHMIRKLVVIQGHPTFEMIVERLVSHNIDV